MKKINLNLKEKGKKVVDYTKKYPEVAIAATCSVVIVVGTIVATERHNRINEKAYKDALEKIVEQCELPKDC